MRNIYMSNLDFIIVAHIPSFPLSSTLLCVQSEQSCHVCDYHSMKFHTHVTSQTSLDWLKTCFPCILLTLHPINSASPEPLLNLLPCYNLMAPDRSFKIYMLRWIFVSHAGHACLANVSSSR